MVPGLTERVLRPKIEHALSEIGINGFPAERLSIEEKGYYHLV